MFGVFFFVSVVFVCFVLGGLFCVFFSLLSFCFGFEFVEHDFV